MLISSLFCFNDNLPAFRNATDLKEKRQSRVHGGMLVLQAARICIEMKLMWVYENLQHRVRGSVEDAAEIGIRALDENVALVTP